MKEAKILVSFFLSKKMNEKNRRSPMGGYYDIPPIGLVSGQSELAVEPHMFICDQRDKNQPYQGLNAYKIEVYSSFLNTLK